MRLRFNSALGASHPPKCGNSIVRDGQNETHSYDTSSSIHGQIGGERKMENEMNQYSRSKRAIK